MVANVGTADSTGVTDSSTQLNAAIAAAVTNGITAGQCLALPAGKFYAPSLSNPTGVQFCGFGVLLKSISQTESGYPNATTAQVNSYTYAAPRIVFGQEYLSHWMYVVESNLPSPSYLLKLSSLETHAPRAAILIRITSIQICFLMTQ